MNGSVTSDIGAIDDLLGRGPGLHVIGSRGGVGKSTLADNHVALPTAVSGGRVLCFNLEMTRKTLNRRRVAKMAGVEARAMIQRPGSIELTDEQKQDVRSAVGVLTGLTTLALDETAGLTIDDILQRARERAARWGGLDLVVIDDLQDIRATGVASESEGYTKSVMALALLADELGASVVLTSQMDPWDDHGMPSLRNFYAAGAVRAMAKSASILWIPDVGAETGEHGLTNARLEVVFDRGGYPSATWLQRTPFCRFEELVEW